MNVLSELKALLALTVVGLLLAVPTASADIRRPGDHVHYGVDLEPHLVLQWAQEEGYDEGFGLGLRASIVLVDNGPVPSINNTLALGVGGDLTFFDGNCGSFDCDAIQFWLPVVAQWNFYLSESFALFPELGLGFQYINRDNATFCTAGRGGLVCDDDDLDVEPVFWLGGRYIVNDAVGFTFRIGYPSITVGASLFL